MKDTQIIVLISKLLQINHAAFHHKYTKTVKIITLAAIIHEHSHYEMKVLLLMHVVSF